jgi:hypothetical protein
MKIISVKTIVLLIAAFSFFSCKKNSDNNYYVKLKVNGSWVTWKVVVGELGPDLADGSKTDFGVTANDDAMKDIFDLSIQIDGSNFTTGSYDSDSPNYWVVISYAKGAGAAGSKYYDITDDQNRPPSRYLVSVTSITDKELRGTFTGNYLHDYIDDESLNITEGEFFVKRAR